MRLPHKQAVKEKDSFSELLDRNLCSWCRHWQQVSPFSCMQALSPTLNGATEGSGVGCEYSAVIIFFRFAPRFYHPCGRTE